MLGHLVKKNIKLIVQNASGTQALTLRGVIEPRSVKIKKKQIGGFFVKSKNILFEYTGNLSLLLRGFLK